MSLKELGNFLNDDNKNEKQEIDWEAHKKEYINAVNELYRNITEWLKPLGNLLEIHFKKIILDEDYVGQYEMDKMVIFAKGHRVVLEPKGTMIIGAKGRIDMVGSYGRARFLLVDKNLTRPQISVRIIDPSIEKGIKEVEKGDENVEYEWKITTLPPNIQYYSLNEDTFSKELLGVLQHG